MRTTYVPKNPRKLDKEVTSPSKSNKIEERDEIIQANMGTDSINPSSDKYEKYSKLYMDIIEEAQLISVIENTHCTNEVNPQIKNSQKSNKKSNKKSKKPLVFFILLLIVCSIVGIAYFKGGFITKDSSEEFKGKIQNLYVDESKSDVRSDVTLEYIDSLVQEANLLVESGKVDSSVLSELATIKVFFEDKTTLLEFSDVQFDYKTAGFEQQLESINVSATAYTIPSLSSTVISMVQGIRKDYDNYITLLSEMQGITDYLNVDTSKYEEAIKGITHVPNKTELSELYATIVAKHIEAESTKNIEDKAKKEADKLKEDVSKKVDSAKKEIDKKMKELENSSTTEMTTEEVSTENVISTTENVTSEPLNK